MNHLSTRKPVLTLERIYWISVCIAVVFLFKFDDKSSRQDVLQHYNTTVNIFKVVFAILCLGAGLFVFHFYKYYLVLRYTPVSKIRSAAQGYVELHGTAKWLEGHNLQSPLMKLPCTWYRFTVEELRGFGKNRHWAIIEAGESTEHFIISDDTDQCVVDPDGADIIPTIENTWKGTSGNMTHITVEKQSFWANMLGGNYRYTESILEENHTIYAAGMFRTLGSREQENPPNANHSLETGMLLKEWKADYQNLLNKFDTNHNGKIDPDEWQEVIKAAELEIQQKYPVPEKKAAESLNVVNLLSQAGLPPGRPFTVAGVSHSAMINCYLYKTALYVFFCLAMGMIGFSLDSWYLDFLKNTRSSHAQFNNTSPHNFQIKIN